MYHTKTTELISAFIKSNLEKSFTASDLADFLKDHGLNVNKTTVYRNLDKLTESGQLIKHRSSINDGFLYQSQAEKHCEEHIHFQCRTCGSVLHLDDKLTHEYLSSISKTLGLEIDLSNSTLNGICPTCRNQKKQN